MFAHIPSGVLEKALAQLCGLGLLGVLSLTFIIWAIIKVVSGRKDKE